MLGASLETTLEPWASPPRDVKRPLRLLFTQARLALSAENFLDALLGERAIAARVPLSFVAADTVHGVIERASQRAGKRYALGVKGNQPLHSWDKPRKVAGTAKEISDALPTSAWLRLSARSGTKGERLHGWAYLELADLDGDDYNGALADQAWTRGLLIRRKIADGDLALFTTWAPLGTTIKGLARIEGHRGAIEDRFETTKNELGLDHNETRSWHGRRVKKKTPLSVTGKK